MSREWTIWESSAGRVGRPTRREPTFAERLESEALFREIPDLRPRAKHTGRMPGPQNIVLNDESSAKQGAAPQTTQKSPGSIRASLARSHVRRQKQGASLQEQSRHQR